MSKQVVIMKNIDIDKDKRKKYWDGEYYEYWKKEWKKQMILLLELQKLLRLMQKLPMIRFLNG